MKHPLISVVVPIYKVEKYLPECIDSILGQTYKNLEVILVDDGSPDGCPVICDNYVKKDERVKVVHKKNGGLSDARNAGLERSSGELICFIDSDDYIAKSYIEDLYQSIEKEGADMSLCGYARVTDDGRVLEKDNLENETITPDKYWKAVYSDHSVSYVVAWNKLYKRELFAKIKYTKGRINEDEIILHHILNQCKKISSIHKIDYYYRVRSDSIVGKNKKGSMTEDGYYGLYERLKYFITKENWEMAEKTAQVLMGHLKDKQLNKKYARKFAKTACVIPKNYSSLYFRTKLFILSWVPYVFSIGGSGKVEEKND